MKKLIVAIGAVALAVTGCSTAEQSFDTAKSEASRHVDEAKSLPLRTLERGVKDVLNKSGTLISEEVRCDADAEKKIGGHITCESRHFRDWTPVTVELMKNDGTTWNFRVLVGGENVLAE